MKNGMMRNTHGEIEVTGFLRSDHTERYCRNGDEIRGSLYMYLWLSGKPIGTGHLFQNDDRDVSSYGGCT